MKREYVWPAIKRICCVLILLCALTMTWHTAWVVSENLLDSDASSEMVLGEKLAREGGIMSETWTYSTELRVISSQIIYSLVFRMCNDWSLVRFWSTVIMHLLLLADFAFLAKESRMTFNRFCIAAAVLLLPFSVPYGRINLYHCYYIFHEMFAILIVALYLRACRLNDQENRVRNGHFWVTLICLMLVSFLAGLGGVRVLMVCTVPLVAAALLSAMTGEDGRKKAGLNRLPECAGALLFSLISLTFSGAGYLVNINVLSNIYKFTSYAEMNLSLSDLEYLNDILGGFLDTLGFHDGVHLFTLHGILGVASFLVCLITLLAGLHTVRHTRDRAARFLNVFMFVAQLTMFCVFMLMDTDGFEIELYFLPVTFWMIPALAKMDLRPDSGMVLPETEKQETSGETEEMPRLLRRDAGMSAHGLISLVALLVMLVNGFYYADYFHDPDKYGSLIEYTGLVYRDTDTVTALTPVAEYLVENEYDMVYADFWAGAVVTELSDGKVKAVPVESGSRKHPIKYQEWLVDQKLYDVDTVAEMKVAILADFELYSELEEMTDFDLEEKESFGGYTVFELKDSAALARDLE